MRTVPAGWLALTRRGPELTLLRPDQGANEGRGLRGIGANGQVVQSAQTGRNFLVDDGVLRPLVNRTSALLARSPVRTVPNSRLLAAPTGKPVGIVDAPASPPAVPPAGTPVTPCVRSSDGVVTVPVSVRDAGTRPSPAHQVQTGSGTLTVTWHFPPGQGALVGPRGLDRARNAATTARDEPTGILLVAGGVGYPVAGLDVLRKLGYQRQQTVLLPRAWLALIEPGATLSAPPRRG